MQIDRKNLAVALEDEQARDAYLYPDKGNHRRTMEMILRPLRGDKKLFAMWLGHGLVFGIRPVLSVFVLGWFVHLLSQGATVGQFLGIAAAVAILYFLLSAAISQFDGHTRANWMIRRVKLVNQIMSQYMRMDFGLFENARFQDAISRWQRGLGGNEAGIEGLWNRSLEGLGHLISSLILGAILLYFLGPWILLPVVLFLVISVYTKSNIARFKFEHWEPMAQAYRRSQRYTGMATDFRYGKDTRLYKMQDRFSEGFHPLIQKLAALLHRFTGRELHWSYLENAALVALDLVLFLLMFRQGLPAAFFIPVLTTGLLFSQSLQMISQFIAFYQTESLYIADVFGIAYSDLRSEQGQGEIPGDHPVEIVLEDVSFSYPGSDRKVLENCNLTLHAGESCALVGVNGAGKTTLVKLITGMYRPTGGRIFINGVDSAEIPQEELFALYGAVFQDAQPLAVSIAEFVAADDQAIDRERVKQALKIAGLWEKINTFDRGIDSQLLKVLHEDGVILSGGENQKLAIARALYREKTRALLLDEPTSALDALAEEKIYREFAAIARGRTTLFISHRLASTRFCHRIAVLSGGSIVQEGTHESLMGEEGLYRSMYETQAKYYQQEAGA